VSTSEKKLAANRANALQSTGPRSARGKAMASRNATHHGLFSTRLFLDDEDPAEFDALLTDLQQALKPVGAVELALVERIAVNMWRQRRLVHAETATLADSRQAVKIAGEVSRELRLGYGHELEEEDLEPVDPERAKWCEHIIDECERLETYDLRSLPGAAPLVFAQLNSDAEEDGDTLESHLEHYDNGLTSYIEELVASCREQLRNAERSPRIQALAEQARAQRLVLSRNVLELFTRYQTTLDNQLYRALRALREAQEWRLKTIEPVPATDGVVEGDAK
jgi:hypothetical protein